MNDLADHIATGGCGDWAAYREGVGHLKGLAEAERFLLDLRERADPD